jgi:hypothetical protein
MLPKGALSSRCIVSMSYLQGKADLSFQADINTFRSSYSAPPVINTAITKSRASAIAMAPSYQSPASAPPGANKLVGPPPPHIVPGSSNAAPPLPGASGLKKRLNEASDVGASPVGKKPKLEDGQGEEAKPRIQGMSGGARRPPPRPVGGAAPPPPTAAIKRKPPPSLFVPSKKVRRSSCSFPFLDTDLSRPQPPPKR